MNDPLVLPTEIPGLMLWQFSNPADDRAYFNLIAANREHLSQFGDRTSANYPDIESVTEARLNPTNPDRLRMGAWIGGNLVAAENLTPRGEHGSEAEIGYLLDARYTGHGYATFATRALVAYAAERYDRVFAKVAQGNDKSAAVLERSGFRYTAWMPGAERSFLEFDHGGLDALLAPGETVTMERPEQGSQRWAYGYNYADIKNNTRSEGDSVVLTVEPGGAVEPVHITGDITLAVRALKGSGALMRYNTEHKGGVDVISMSVGDEPVILRRGDAYYYHNPYDQELVVRDDCTPPFRGTDEVELVVAPSGAGGPDGREVKLLREFWSLFTVRTAEARI